MVKYRCRFCRKPVAARGMCMAHYQFWRRHHMGEMGNLRKLTDEDRADICRLYELGFTKVQLADRYDVVHASIGYVLRRYGNTT